MGSPGATYTTAASNRRFSSILEQSQQLELPRQPVGLSYSTCSIYALAGITYKDPAYDVSLDGQCKISERGCRSGSIPTPKAGFRANAMIPGQALQGESSN